MKELLLNIDYILDSNSIHRLLSGQKQVEQLRQLIEKSAQQKSGHIITVLLYLS